jgi:hypothetical protein
MALNQRKLFLLLENCYFSMKFKMNLFFIQFIFKVRIGWVKLKNLIFKINIYFLGSHSEIYGECSFKYFKLLLQNYTSMSKFQVLQVLTYYVCLLQQLKIMWALIILII